MSTPQSYNKVDSASPLNAKDSAVKANIEALADLFPAAVQEGVVDFDALTRILGGKTEPQPERFGLNWCGKAAAHAGALVDSAGTLRPCREESKDWDTTKNLYIEGDNLEVLKLLRNSYRGKVKMIYIDPPYNTGKDFVYKDNFHDSIKNYQQITGQQNELKENTETSGRYHTDWLNMMYPRLMLARELLSDDGVIFISIDDNEVDNLRNICNEILGETNFRNSILVRRRTKSLNSQFEEKGLQTLNVGFEYVLVYAKSREFMMKALRNKKKVHQEEGKWQGFWSNADRPTMRYEILGFTPVEGQWRTSKEKADKAVTNYVEYLEKYADHMSLEEYSERTGIVNFIKRNPNGQGQNGGVYHWVAPSDTMLRTSNWTDLEVSQIFKEIDLPFENPKNVSLISELVKLSEFRPTDIILDFFSGSATTAHAVMKLNAEDGGSRQFIMVQLPERDEKSEAFKAGYKTICDIGKERIRRAGEKVKAEAGARAKDLDIGFRVYKLDSSNVCAWDPDTQDIEKSLEQAANHLKSERTEEDIMTELMLRFGIMLTNNVEKQECGDTGLDVYNIGCGRHFACLDERLAAHAEEVAHFILEWHKEENPGTHEEEAKDSQVFVVDKAFVGNDAAKKNFCAILSDYGIKQVNAF